MLLKDAPFYQALCWAIKKYIKCELPYPDTGISDETNIKHKVSTMCYWAESFNGDSYWRKIDRDFHFRYGYQRKYYNYSFKEIMDDFNKNPQLEFDFEGDKQ